MQRTPLKEGRKTYLNNVPTLFPCKEPRIEKISSVKEEVETVGEVQVEEFEQPQR